MLKAAVWQFKFSNWWNDVAGDLGLLARQAFPGPFGDVLAHGRPHDLLRNGLSRPLHAWMA